MQVTAYLDNDKVNYTLLPLSSTSRESKGKKACMSAISSVENILSMVLDDNYVKKLPSWASLLIAVFVCWLHMSFFVRYYLESHIWFHLVAKIAQVLSAIFFVWLGIYLFDQYRLKVDLKLSLIVIVLAVDVIYFYEAWAVWMHKKYKYHTVFKPHHH